MNKKYNRASSRGASKVHCINLDAYLRKNKRVVMAITEIKRDNGTAIYKVNLPPVKRVGKNYIEISELTGFEPEVLIASPEIKKYEVSPQVLKLARLMERIPIATLKRMARDLTDI